MGKGKRDMSEKKPLCTINVDAFCKALELEKLYSPSEDFDLWDSGTNRQDLMCLMSRIRHTGLTLAPEAGTQRLPTVSSFTPNCP